jgi:hypothetical protein
MTLTDERQAGAHQAGNYPATIDRLAQYLSDRYDVIHESGQEAAREILAIVRESRLESSDTDDCPRNLSHGKARKSGR